jgi:hypothetical protein
MMKIYRVPLLHRRTVLAIVVMMMMMVQACERPYATRPIGPFFNTFAPGAQLSHIPFLWTTASDDTILLATLTRYDADSNYLEPLNVTISLPDGTVTEGWPEDASPTVPPEQLADPTAGYALVVTEDGSTATLVKGSVSLTIELKYPEHNSGFKELVNHTQLYTVRRRT